MSANVFHLGDLLSVTTGRLVSPTQMDGVHRLLDYMTGDTLFTHQLPRACDECKPALLAQYPFLAKVETPDEFDGKSHVDSWLDSLVAEHGAEFEVQPLDSGDHTRINPIAELRMMAPGKPIIAVELGGDS